MDYETVISLAEIIKWPFVAIVAIFILKKPLSEMINGVIDFNVGGKNGVSARVQKTQTPSSSQSLKKNKSTDDLNENFFSKSRNGLVAFDYSNNDGIYTVGEDEFRFDTMWSKASNESIHFYNDKPTIKTVRLVKDKDDLNTIDPNKYDSSSRARTANIGQVAVFENIYGNFLLAKVIDVKDDSRGDQNDELTFKYITRKKDRR